MPPRKGCDPPIDWQDLCFMNNYLTLDNSSIEQRWKGNLNAKFEGSGRSRMYSFE